MAHFVQLDSDNKVITIIVVANEDCLDSENNESEAVGIQFCKNLLGQDTNWIQTSYNHRMRKQYAAIGGSYDSVKDQFVNRSPYPSWTLDASNDWQPPTAKPAATAEFEDYYWNEGTQAWVGEVVTPDPPPPMHYDAELGYLVPD